ncbi:MAG TPA: MFS transporter [Trebonia sp.]
MVILREPARPAVIREHPLAPWFAVAAVCFGAFMGQLDASVVTVAFPALQRQFGAGLASVQWVSLAYLLVLTALLVPAGRWSDRAGRKLVYLYGFVVFAGSSAACGLAPSLGALTGLRVVQAAGAALLQAGTVLLRHERRVAAPLLDLRAMAAAGTGAALLGALCAYLVLFGPLVLFPQVVSARGGSAESAGLLLTALPAGFGLAAAVADGVLPARWANRRRCLLGGAVVAACAAALAVPAPHAVSVVLLGLLGIGLGIYTPANNAEIMAAVPARDAAAAGGMVNMTRGIGTALGVAVVTLGLHAGALLRSPDAGLALSMAALAAVALLGTAAALRARPAADGPR